MQNFALKYELSLRALLYYYSNFFRTVGINALCLRHLWRHRNQIEIFRLLKWQVQKKET